MLSSKTIVEPQETWQDVPLGDERYFQLATGGTPSTEKKEYWENGTIPWLSSGEVHKKIIRSADGRITDKGFQSSNARFYPPHSILIALAGQGKTRGTAAITEVEVTSNQSIAAIIPNKELVEPYFVYYYLDSLYQELRSISAGAGRAGLSLSILADVSIKLPDKHIQESIATVLSCIDRAIGQTETLMAKQQRIKIGLMQGLLTKGIDEHGNIRSEATHEFKDSPLGRIPKEWGFYKLGDVCERIVVGLATSVTPYYREAGVPIIRNQNIKSGYFDGEEILYLDPAFCAENKPKAVKANDVVTVRTGAYLGLTCLVPNDFDGAQTFTTLITTPDSNLLLPNYLVFHMNSDKGIAEIEQLKAGGGKSNLNVGELIQYRIALPQISEQQQVVKVLNNANLATRQYEPLLQKLESIKQGLMQDLLTGEVSIESLLREQSAAIA